MLENDLILGSFAKSSKFPSLPSGTLSQYDTLLSELDIDIYNWVVGKEQAPEKYSEILGHLKNHLRNGDFINAMKGKEI